MSDPVDSLILDLVEWLAPSPQPYAEVMERWRTSCPHLPVWEEANDRGYLVRERATDGALHIAVTDAGRAFLARHRGAVSVPP